MIVLDDKYPTLLSSRSCNVGHDSAGIMIIPVVDHIDQEVNIATSRDRSKRVTSDRGEARMRVNSRNDFWKVEHDSVKRRFKFEQPN